MGGDRGRGFNPKLPVIHQTPPAGGSPAPKLNKSTSTHRPARPSGSFSVLCMSAAGTTCLVSQTGRKAVSMEPLPSLTPTPLAVSAVPVATDILT